MIPLRTRATTLSFGVPALGVIAALVGIAEPAAVAGEGGGIVVAADRCAILGPGYFDLGNGICGRNGGHVRMEIAPGTSRRGDWNGSSGSASSTALRSDGLGMLPGAGDTRHLRIRADPDFR